MEVESGTKIVNLFTKENSSKIRNMEKEANIIKMGAIWRDNGCIVSVLMANFLIKIKN